MNNTVIKIERDFYELLQLLDGFDNKNLKRLQSEYGNAYRLSYQEIKGVISELRFNEKNRLFAVEKDDSFMSSINTIYQTFDGEELYPTPKDKAINLLYLVTKNHSFIDGNKRIAAYVFLYFLHKNNMLYTNELNKKIDDKLLATIVILIAVSNPNDKEDILSFIYNVLDI